MKELDLLYQENGKVFEIIKFLWVLSRYTRGGQPEGRYSPKMMAVTKHGDWEPMDLPENKDPDDIFVQAAQRFSTDPDSITILWMMDTKLSVGSPTVEPTKCWMMVALTPYGIGPCCAATEQSCVNIFDNSPIRIKSLADLDEAFDIGNFGELVGDYLQGVLEEEKARPLSPDPMKDDGFYLMPESWFTVDGVNGSRYEYYLKLFKGMSDTVN